MFNSNAALNERALKSLSSETAFSSLYSTECQAFYTAAPAEMLFPIYVVGVSADLATCTKSSQI